MGIPSLSGRRAIRYKYVATLWHTGFPLLSLMQCSSTHLLFPLFLDNFNKTATQQTSFNHVIGITNY